LYLLLKFPANLAFKIWCRHLSINKKDILNTEGPLLIASNHPNSFLDAIILATLFKRPVYSLARGDAFENPFYKKLLTALKMLPVYRLSEGAEHLEHNYHTFDTCRDIFIKKGIVLIFSEGKCINEWHLRPLKKGTARLAIISWATGIDLKVVPLGINYSSFSSFGKNLQLNVGNVITAENIGFNIETADGKSIHNFNIELQKQLRDLVFENKPEERNRTVAHFHVPVPVLKKIVLAIPAAAGLLLHFPLFVPIELFAFKKFGKIDHYDAAMVGLLFLLYPFYLLLIGVLAGIFIGSYWWLLTFVLPFCAWSFVQLKRQF
jgi:1-acyl-sn-glycerol-3-phosphate acyltransferase